MPPPSKAAMIVGTHKDKLKGDNTVIDSIEARIQSELDTLLKCDRMDEQDYHKNLCKYDGRVLTAVDNTRGNEEVQQHRNLIEQILKDRFYSESEFPIPASWLMFSIFLRKIERNILSFQQCQIIANELGIEELEELKDVLLFLHHDIGIIMYYASNEIEKLEEDVIICQPQVMFKSIGELILDVFLPEQCHDDHIRDNFWKKGQFKQRDIENSFSSTDDQLSPKQLIAILEYLNVLVQLTSGVFFMPAVMKAAPKDVLDRYIKHCSVIAPLLIRFNCVFVPIGCFTAMIARLVCDRTKNKWQLVEEDYLYKDVVTFRLQGNFKATLICRPKWYEIHLSPIPNSESTRRVEEIASKVRKTVCGALDCVLDKLRDQYATADLAIYSLVFFCGCKGLSGISEDGTDGQQHLMLVNADNESLASCIDTRREMKLKPAHLVWNGSHKFGSKFFGDA